MRPLVMDFRDDRNTWNIADQFMFGPAILVSPVVKAGATARAVYLPEKSTWFDFWTGNSAAGGQTLEAAAPLDRMPLYVRAGSIVPMGPEIQYADEDANGPIELRVYPGANGSFDLYDDSGDSYDYTHGQHAVIPVSWDDKAGVLTLGARQGSFPGMATKRVFRVVLVREGHGTGEGGTSQADRQLTYDGSEIHAQLKR